MNIQKLVKEAFQSIISEEYNGHKNFPTFVVVTSILDSQEDIEHWGEQAVDAYNTALEEEGGDVEKAKRTAQYRLSETMKEYFMDTVPSMEGINSHINNDLLQYTFNEVDWYSIAGRFLTEETLAAASDSMMDEPEEETLGTADHARPTGVFSRDIAPISLNENEMPVDAEYMMVSVKGTGKDEQFGIFVMPRTMKTYFQDPIKLVNAITNERGKYSFVKYVKDPKDPNLNPKPAFMQIIKAFKMETHDLNPQHNPESPEAQPIV